MLRSAVATRLQDRIEELTLYLSISTEADDAKEQRCDTRPLKTLYSEERAAYGYYNGKPAIGGTIRHCLEYPGDYPAGTTKLSELIALLIEVNLVFYTNNMTKYNAVCGLVDNITQLAMYPQTETKTAIILAKVVLAVRDRELVIKILNDFLVACSK